MSVTLNYISSKGGIYLDYVDNPAPNLNVPLNFTLVITFTTNVVGAEIVINGQTLTTDSVGNASIELSPGTYTYTISKEGYQSDSGSVTLSNTSVVVDITLLQSVFTVTFDVNVGGATVTLDGEEKTADAEGIVTFEKENGTYSYTVTLDGYDENTGSVTVNDADVSETVTMIESTYTITIGVVDESSNMLSGATVTLDGEEKVTDASGVVTYEKVNGTYAYTVTLDGYDENTGSVTVNGADVSETVTMVESSYTVTFNITDSDTSEGLEGAEIVINGQTLTTNESGIATIELENDTYEYSVTATGYESATGSVTVNGSDVSETVELADTSSFVFIIDTSLGDGDNTFQLPLRSGYNNNFVVNWDDGSTDTITSYNQAETEHTYSVGGIYTIKIKGTCEAWYFNNGGDKDKLTEVIQLGSVGWVNMERAFQGCSNLTSVGGSNCDTSSVQNASRMFNFCQALSVLDVSSWDTASLQDASFMFANCRELSVLDVSNWNTSSLENARYLFLNCLELNSLDVSSWNTASLQNASYMFYGCQALNSLDVSSWNTSSLQNALSMFYNCQALNVLDVSSWNTASLQNASYMFYGCQALNSLDVSSWNTSSLQDASRMFYNCQALSVLDVSSWNTSSLQDTTGMFYNCQALNSLNLSSWNTSSLGNATYMFWLCTSLTTINWFTFASQVGNLGVQNTALEQTYVDELFDKLEDYYAVNPPTKALTVNVSGGTADAPSATGEAEITLLESYFTSAGQTLTITTN